MDDLNSVRRHPGTHQRLGDAFLFGLQKPARTWDWQIHAFIPPSTRWPSPLSATRRPDIGVSQGQSAALRTKRNFDILVSACALAALMPLLAIVAVLIKTTSSGPIFFRQQREGLLGVPFQMLKFRSMHVAASDATGIEQTVQNDPRVTWIGQIIRKTSIDELPQLLNVLRGDMSLVGPRPHVAGMKAAGVIYRDLVPYYDQRLQVLPGLTGLAQASGLRGETTDPGRARARIDYDIAYIQNYSLWLDIKIIAKTIRSEFIGGSGQ